MERRDSLIVSFSGSEDVQTIAVNKDHTVFFTNRHLNRTPAH